MKKASMVRKIDKLGRVVLPNDIRKILGLKHGSSLVIKTTNEGILLKRYIPDWDLIDDIETLNTFVEEQTPVIGLEKSEKIQEYLQKILLLLRED